MGYFVSIPESEVHGGGATEGHLEDHHYPVQPYVCRMHDIRYHFIVFTRRHICSQSTVICNMIHAPTHTHPSESYRDEFVFISCPKHSVGPKLFDVAFPLFAYFGEPSKV